MSQPLRITATHVEAFRNDLLAWYDAVRREMPWRETSDPYRIWLSEIMLQQTRVDQAEPYYRRFVERFPTVDHLANADLDDVLLCWEGLGYYSRARNLHRAARKVVDEHGGTVPSERKAIRSLPGVGPYTAAAVLSIAYDEPEPVLDGNVVRVLTRVFRVDADASKAATRRSLRAAAGELIDAARPGDFNQALMELGATVCRPRNPDCEACPVRSVCAATAFGDAEAYPVTAPKGRVPHHDVVVAILRDGDGRLLIQRRAEGAMLGGLWEFPGGKRKEGESLEEACRREIMEEVGVDVALEGLFHELSHAYSHFRITLYAFLGHVASGRARPLHGQPMKWVLPSELDSYAFPRANRRLIERLHARHREPSLFDASAETDTG